jgi:hypothetical protein
MRKRISDSDISDAVKRYANGDWGEVLSSLAMSNVDAVIKGVGPILSVYKASDGRPFMLITLFDLERVFVVGFVGAVWLLILVNLSVLTIPLRRFLTSRKTR